MSNTTEAFMFELLRFFMRPYRMKWDMNGRSSYLEGRRNVALETVAHHHQFLRQHAQLTTKSAISFRFLVAHDAHHIKISLQSRSPEFILLILQFALGKDRQLIFRLSEFEPSPSRPIYIPERRRICSRASRCLICESS